MQAYSPAQLRLLRRYMARLDRVATSAGAALATAWADVGSLTDADLAAFIERGRPAARAVAAEASSLTSGYMGALLGEAVAAADVYVEPDWRSPLIRARMAVAAGVEFDEALLIGASQAEAIGSDAAVSAARRAGDSVQSDQITGWRRVLDADPCDWCVTVSSRVYNTAESADFGHNRCKCGVTPVTRSTPGAS